MSTTHPIRLIMFSSADCLYCPPIERITYEVIGQGMESFVHVSIIDVDHDPEAKVRYNVTTLPTLMINEEIVLSGGMDDDTVRETLLNTIMMKAVSTKELEERSKRSLIHLTMNFWDSLNGSKLLRPTIGDYVHLAPYHYALLSLYSLDPLVPNMMYKAGRQLGLTGLMNHLFNVLEPRLGRTGNVAKKFKYLGEAFEIYFADRELMPTYLADSATLVEVTKSHLILDVKALASASIGIVIEEPLCDFTSGQLAGITTALMGTNAKCEELQCAAMGYDTCRFKITLLELNETWDRPLPSSETKIDRSERKQNFYEVIHELTIKLNESIIMRKQLRRMGDYVHISILQPVIVSLKLLDEFTGSILFTAGKELGVFGPGKNLLHTLIQNMGVNAPVDFDTGVMLVYQSMKHPASTLNREWSEVKLLPKNPALTNYREIQVHEYCAISGIQNIGMTFCDFLAGFIAGRLMIITGNDINVREVQCQGTGAAACVFGISINT